jgi:hypothetical protein
MSELTSPPAAGPVPAAKAPKAAGAKTKSATKPAAKAAPVEQPEEDAAVVAARERRGAHTALENAIKRNFHNAGQQDVLLALAEACFGEVASVAADE